MSVPLLIKELEHSLTAIGLDGDIPLTPDDVYAARFGENKDSSAWLAHAEWPQRLRFSRYPVRPTLSFSLTSKGVQPRVEFAKRSGEVFPLSSIPPSAQVILGGVWHPILASDYVALQEILNTEPGTTLGIIALRDFVRMCRHPLSDRILGAARNAGLEMLAALVHSGEPSPALNLAPDVELRPYQQVGWNWLSQMSTLGTGGILADEMGLGKTLQVIALMSSVAISERRPILLVVPSSLVPNWRRELLRFCPSLSWVIHRGTGRATSRRDLQHFAVVITTYDILVIDQSLFLGMKWALFVCDEAHAIRNPETERFRAASFLRSRFPSTPAVAITGTPIQNSLRDAWALLEFVVPGVCGERRHFSDVYCDDVESALALEPRLSPFMLRRLVKDVAKDLPELIHIPQVLEMTHSEALGYEALRSRLVLTRGGMLAAMTPLRMWCCHPRLKAADWMSVDIASTGKFARLIEIVLEIRRVGEKALIFTSYNHMAQMIREHFGTAHGIWCDTVSGEDRPEDRQKIIDEFSGRIGTAMLVLNPQAAGVGLNIQAANHVIHYNLEWNPAVEEQATARAYRRGQDRPVRVHRLFYRSTIEEVINARVELKRNLISSAVRGVTGDEATDIATALAMSPLASNSEGETHLRS